MMAEAIPRLAIAMRSVLADAQVTVSGTESIQIRFDGLPSMKIEVVRHLVNNQFQMIESRLDLAPLCISTLSRTDLSRLAAMENLGMRGISVLPVSPEQNHGRAALRLRTGFVGQKGRTKDEVENLAIDILTTIAFARQLEDRLTENSVAGEFSFELYQTVNRSRPTVPIRVINHGQSIFSGSTDRVFAQICATLRNDFQFGVTNVSPNTARIDSPRFNGGDRAVEMLAKIPSESPIFMCQANLMKLEAGLAESVWTLLADLNAQVESGHFEWNPIDRVLSFVSWKHLTNDLRHFSFDYVIFSATHAMALALETLKNRSLDGSSSASDSGAKAKIIPFPLNETENSASVPAQLKKAA